MRKHQHYKLYQAINELGRHAFYIEFLEDYPCQKREELLKREGKKIKEHQRELNTIVSGRTKKEYRQDKFQQIQNKQKEIYERNRSKLIKYQKDYGSNNQDMLKLKSQQYLSQQYYEKNKEQIKEKKGSITAITRAKSKNEAENTNRKTMRQSKKGEGDITRKTKKE